MSLRGSKKKISFHLQAMSESAFIVVVKRRGADVAVGTFSSRQEAEVEQEREKENGARIICLFRRVPQWASTERLTEEEEKNAQHQCTYISKKGAAKGFRCSRNAANGEELCGKHANKVKESEQCPFILIKGERKGQKCGSKKKQDFCAKHLAKTIQ
jgi:hypothetical protein